MEIIAAGKKLSLILIYRAINWFIAYRDRPSYGLRQFSCTSLEAVSSVIGCSDEPTKSPKNKEIA